MNPQEKLNPQNDSLRIGTSGFSYDDWRGVFYPQKIVKNKMLEFYIRHFNTVEINSSYYHIPTQQIIKGLAERSPDDFEFIVKVNRETTHRRIENETAMKMLNESLIPLTESGKLKGLLAQFPYSFKNTEVNRKYLADTVHLARHEKLFFEFRHNSWLHDAIPSFLKALGVGYVNVDEPALKGLLPPSAIATSDVGYIRFHGRNEKLWWEGKGSERYDYLYSENELYGWQDNIAQLLKTTSKIYIFFNNHPGGQAVKNARQLNATF